VAKGNQEIEIKLRVKDAASARRMLREAGFRVRKRRVFEANRVYDTAALSLRTAKQLLRLRTVGARSVLTFKGAPLPGKHKRREEWELTVSDGAAMEAILTRLGFELTFRYEKYRTEFSRDGEAGVVTVDETPIGTFLELEGPADWIDRTAGELGFRAADYITLSYGSLYLEYCQVQGVAPSHMVFPAAAGPGRGPRRG